MKWENVAEIINALEENYPDEEIENLSLRDVEDLVRSLDEFEDAESDAEDEKLDEIRSRWIELRDSV